MLRGNAGASARVWLVKGFSSSFAARSVKPPGRCEEVRGGAREGTIVRMISHGKRWKYAFRAFFSLIFHGRIADDILAAFVPASKESPSAPAAAPAAVAPAAETTDRATQILAILQRDGRLIDFLMEDLSAYPDAQIGAAVRDVHAGCRQSISRYLTLEPVLDDEEGKSVTIERGTDAARIKVVGNIAGTPPFRGVVRHRGWEATRVELPPLGASSRTIVAPAEVEVA